MTGARPGTARSACPEPLQAERPSRGQADAAAMAATHAPIVAEVTGPRTISVSGEASSPTARRLNRCGTSPGNRYSPLTAHRMSGSSGARRPTRRAVSPTVRLMPGASRVEKACICEHEDAHHELMVQSRQGYKTAATQGWHNGGIALYGYRFTVHPHPNPHKARTGLVERTLDWTRYGRLSCAESTTST